MLISLSICGIIAVDVYKQLFFRKEFSVMKKRITAVILLMCMALSIFASCSSADSYEYNSYSDYIQLGDASQIKILQSDIDESIIDSYFNLFDEDDDLKEVEYDKATENIEVKYGDTLTIDYVGTVDGETFEGGTAKDQSLKIGSGSYIDGFEDGLMGYGVGDKAILNLKFPDDYKSEELAGKDVKFEVTIKKLKRTEYPEYNDENVKKYSDNKYATVADFEKQVTEASIKNLVWQEYFNLCKVKKYPEAELKDYYYSTIDTYKSYAAMFGTSFESYVVSYSGYSSLQAFYQGCASQAQQQVKQDLMVLAMAESIEGIAYDDQRLDEEFQRIYGEQINNKTFKGSYKKFLRTYGVNPLKIEVYTDVVMDYLLEHKTITDDVTKNGFVTDKNGTRYYENDKYLTGWVDLDIDGDGKTEAYYFNPENGYAYINTAVLMYPRGNDETSGVDKIYLSFGENGVYKGVYTGVFNDGKGYLYIKEGVVQTGLIELDRQSDIAGNEKYYFDPDNSGYMALGIVKLNNADIFGADNGKYYNFGTTGIYDPDGTVIPEGLDDDNGFANGLVSEKGENDQTLYRLFDNGTLLVGKQTYNKKEYCFDRETGYMVVKAFYTDEDGSKYYCDENGYIYKGKPMEIDGIRYTFDEKTGKVTAEEPVSQ